MKLVQVKLSALKANGKPLEQQNVEVIEESIRLNGLLSPLIINNQNVVLAGNHRLAALAKIQSKDKGFLVTAYQYESENITDQELITIEENLGRRSYTVLELCDLVAKKIELAEKSDGQIKYKNTTICSGIAKQLGTSERDIFYKKKISKLSDRVKKLIIAAKLENKATKLKAISKLASEEEQVDFINRNGADKKNQSIGMKAKSLAIKTHKIKHLADELLMEVPEEEKFDYVRKELLEFNKVMTEVCSSVEKISNIYNEIEH